MSLAPLPFLAASAVQAGIVLVPAYVIAAIKRSHTIATATTLTLVLYLGQALILVAPTVGPMEFLRFNWLQKIAVFGLTLLAIRTLKFGNAECGLVGPNSKKAWLVALGFGVIASLPAITSTVINNGFEAFYIERFLFELTLPGLQEESFYRGLLLCVWDKAIGRPYKLLGVEFGWGAIISLALFCLGHLFAFDRNFQFLVNPDPFQWFDLIFFTILVTWLRYKYTSIWPGVLAHNLGNTLEVLAGLLVRR